MKLEFLSGGSEDQEFDQIYGKRMVLHGVEGHNYPKFMVDVGIIINTTCTLRCAQGPLATQ